MVKVQLINCILIDDCIQSSKLIEEFISNSLVLKLIGTFNDSEEARKVILRYQKIDLIILNVQNTKMNGLDFLRSLVVQPYLIVVSTSDKFALEAFDFNVVDYLLEPFSYWRFCKAIDKVISKVFLKPEPEGVVEEVFVKKESELVRLKLRELIYIEALENYVILNKNNERYTILFTMKALVNQLPSDVFIRIHRSYIVNKSMIQTIKDDSIYLNVGGSLKRLPMSRSYRDSLLTKLNVLAR